MAAAGFHTGSDRFVFLFLRLQDAASVVVRINPSADIRVGRILVETAAGSDGDVNRKHLLLKQNKTCNYINLQTADDVLI